MIPPHLFEAHILQIMKKLILLIVGFFMACGAQSQTYSWFTNTAGTAVAASAQASCTAWAQIQAAGAGGSNWDGRLSQPSPDPNNPTLWNCAVFTAPAPTGEYRTAALTVRGTQIVDACAAKAGQSTTVNFTEGYTRTNEEGDRSAVGPVNTPPASGEMCSAGCKVAVQTSGPGVQPYVSAVPTSQGLFRRSLDLPAQHLGVACTGGAGGSSTSDSPVNPQQASPPCPGFVGEVNGKLGCYGTASQPVTTSPIPRSTDKPPVSGNPAAGEKPASGEGSGNTGAGRTPSAGVGGSSGGPATAAVNPKGTGTIAAPEAGEEQAACGAPGQPKCGIDENGTPDGKGALPTTDFDAKLKEREDALAGIISTAGKDTSWGVLPQWTQGGTCQPWHMYTLPSWLNSYSVDIDLCPQKPFADGIANFIWIALAFFGITSMVFAAMTSKGS